MDYTLLWSVELQPAMLEYTISMRVQNQSPAVMMSNVCNAEHKGYALATTGASKL